MNNAPFPESGSVRSRDEGHQWNSLWNGQSLRVTVLFCVRYLSADYEAQHPLAWSSCEVISHCETLLPLVLRCRGCTCSTMAGTLISIDLSVIFSFTLDSYINLYPNSLVYILLRI